MQIFVSASLLVAVVIFDVVNAKDRRQLENGHIDNAQNFLFNGGSCESYTGGKIERYCSRWGGYSFYRRCKVPVKSNWGGRRHCIGGSETNRYQYSDLSISKGASCGSGSPRGPDCDSPLWGRPADQHWAGTCCNSCAAGYAGSNCDKFPLMQPCIFDVLCASGMCDSNTKKCRPKSVDWKVDSHLQYAYIKDTAKWTDAASFCAGEGAQLASIKSQAEQDFVGGSLMGGTVASTWIGASDTGEEDVWVWEDGTSAAKGNAAVFSQWLGSEPNDSNGEDCAALSTDFRWNDAGCENVYRFICQKCAPGYKINNGQCVATTTTRTATTRTATTTTLNAEQIMDKSSAGVERSRIEIVTDFKADGMSAAELLSKGFTVQDLYDAGFTTTDLEEAYVKRSQFELPETFREEYNTLLESLATTTTTTIGRKVLLAGGGNTNVPTTNEAKEYASSEPCQAGEFWNTDAYLGRGGCYPCRSGTFAEGVDILRERKGDQSYICPGSCNTGFITDPGATSAEECRVGYVVRWGPFDGSSVDYSESCDGVEKRVTVPANDYPNVGYHYITDPDECVAAASILKNAGLEEITTDVLSNICQGNETSESDYHCQRTLKPPIGFCGVQQMIQRRRMRSINATTNNASTSSTTSTGASQELVFYKSAAEADLLTAHYFQPIGYKFVAICKLVQCNHLEVIRSSKKRAWLTGPREDDAAVCLASPAQLKVWQEMEVAQYHTFYILAAVVTLLLYAGLYYREKRLQRKTGKSLDSKRLLFKIIGGFFLSLKVWDLMTDYAFTIISVSTPRFRHMLEESGEFPNITFAGFQSASIFFTILSTLVMVPDIIMFQERAKALEKDEQPPDRSMYFGLCFVILEDVPQLILGFIYIAIVGKDTEMEGYVFEGEDVDTITVLTIVMSIFGIIFHVVLAARPDWFYNTVDPTTGIALKHMEKSSFEKRIGRRANELYLNIGSGGDKAKAKATPSRSVTFNAVFQAEESANAEETHESHESADIMKENQTIKGRVKHKCARGVISGGRMCKTAVETEGSCCKVHTCNLPGCNESKSSKAKVCPVHTAEAEAGGDNSVKGKVTKSSHRAVVQNATYGASDEFEAISAAVVINVEYGEVHSFAGAKAKRNSKNGSKIKGRAKGKRKTKPRKGSVHEVAGAEDLYDDAPTSNHAVIQNAAYAAVEEFEDDPFDEYLDVVPNSEEV